MKKVFSMMLGASLVLAMASCGSSKKAAETPHYDKTKNIAGETVVVKAEKMHGVELAEELSEDGTKIVKVPYKWYAGKGKANVEQVAITLAQQEAYAEISRVFNNIVSDKAERGNVVNNGEVQQALTQHWKQMSLSILKGCEPFGDVLVEYNPADKMYYVTAKIGMRGDRFNELLNNAQNFKPNNLSGEDMEQFVEVNKSIMSAAKGE